MVPDDLLMVACVPADELLSVTKLPTVPVRLKSENVFVVEAGIVMVAGCTVFVILANVFDPVIVSAPVPPWLIVGYEKPPPAKVFADPDVRLIVPVPVVVSPDPLAVKAAAPELVTTNDPPEPKAIVRDVDPVDLNSFVPVAGENVSVYPFKSSVPACTSK